MSKVKNGGLDQYSAEPFDREREREKVYSQQHNKYIALNNDSNKTKWRLPERHNAHLSWPPIVKMIITIISNAAVWNRWCRRG